MVSSFDAMEIWCVLRQSLHDPGVGRIERRNADVRNEALEPFVVANRVNAVSIRIPIRQMHASRPISRR